MPKTIQRRLVQPGFHSGSALAIRRPCAAIKIGNSLQEVPREPSFCGRAASAQPHMKAQICFA